MVAGSGHHRRRVASGRSADGEDERVYVRTWFERGWRELGAPGRLPVPPDRAQIGEVLRRVDLRDFFASGIGRR